MAELHFEPSKNLDMSGKWYRDMKGYHWFVLAVAALGWLFDCLDQQLFIMARPAAMRDLLSVTPASFEDYVGRVTKAVPEGVSPTPLNDFLDAAKKRLTQTRRQEFATLSEKLAADVKAAKTDTELAAAVATANESFEKASNKGVMEVKISEYSNYVTSIFLIGWASGGLFFGVMGDRVGRAKTMLVTILLYSAFTGLSSISTGFWDFAFYRFLTGLGVGGEFAVGVALVAEVMPERARSATLTILQMLSAFGNIGAALISMTLGMMEEKGLVDSPWRKMFLIGALPALLAVLVRWKLKEPERWKQLSSGDAVNKQLGSYRALFSPRWRRNAFVGLVLAFSGVVGLWGVGFFAPDLTRVVLRDKLTVRVFESQLAEANPLEKTGLITILSEHKARALEDKNPQLAANFQSLIEKSGGSAGSEPTANDLKQMRAEVQKGIDGHLTYWTGVSSICMQIGAFFGMFAFGYVAQVIGRRPTFAIAFTTSALSTIAVFLFLNDFSQLFWMLPIMGFFQLSVFAGYAVYFPELFPTHLRSTGTSFCYNVGRFVAATGPFAKGHITAMFAEAGGTPLQSMRYAGSAMCAVFLIGILVLPFAPETKGKPLPE